MSYTIINTDALSALKWPSMQCQSVHMCCTSPPYWGLRDYKLEPLVWDAPANGCEHNWGNEQPQDSRHRYTAGNSSPKHTAADAGPKGRGCWCSVCGAWRGNLGNETTPELYVEHLVQIFRQVRRVLRPDGTLWIVIGDSYASQGGPEPAQTKWKVDGASKTQHEGRSRTPGGLKPKDLVGIPWMVAFALRADGWWLRSDIIWHKPNPMPESVADRPTKAHENIFLLSKASKYFYDAEAIKEPAICGDPRKPYAPGQVDVRGDGHARGGGKIRPTVLRGGFNGKTEAMADEGRNAFLSIKDWRNKRSVWTIAPKPFKGAHFAVFPPALVEPMILAGCPPGGIVLDPFAGAGTTSLVAERLGRNSIGVDPNPAYCKMAKERIEKDRGAR